MTRLLLLSLALAAQTTQVQLIRVDLAAGPRTRNIWEGRMTTERLEELARRVTVDVFAYSMLYCSRWHRSPYTPEKLS